ncbi:ADP-ribosylglycohydrolase domain-containing protein [Trichoderma velutinum]
MSSIPDDYLHRVYAGVLGKLVGVYLGRPFENWTYQEIQDKLGDIHYYVHDKLDLPLVVIDDDVSGTFTFVRALEEHGASADLSSEDVGNTWLNNVVERRSVFWWGGNGISTEHTAFLNLKNGITAPASGACKTNGRTLAEQIGAQIFIDGWAMVAPGNQALAAQLAEAAARVSHDGEAVYAAKLWAVMEAEAFLSSDVNRLLDVGLAFVPADSIIACMIADVRRWVQEDGDWRQTRQRIEENYGYDKYAGICHVVPNHAIMVMALLYAGHDFHEAMHVINTCGWDTDCNAGNVACLVALMHGLAAFQGGPDWLGPLADRAIISSADGGYSINNAARIAYDIANLGQRLSGNPILKPPKGGAQFHFSLPGSVQGFQATANPQSPSDAVRISQGQDSGISSLCIHIKNLRDTSAPVEVMTATFTPLDILQVDRNYEIMASPLMYPGQRVKAELHAADSNNMTLTVRLRIKAYDENDVLTTVDSMPINMKTGQHNSLEWTIPDSLQNWPIQQIGIAISTAKGSPNLNGTIYLHSLRWDGVPRMTLKRPANKSRYQSFWNRAWVSSVDKVHTDMGPSFFIAQDRGEGLLSQGARDWIDYDVMVSNFVVNFGGSMGVAARVQGLNRYYGLMLTKDKRVALIKAVDDKRIELMSMPFEWEENCKYQLHLRVQGSKIEGQVGQMRVTAVDDDYVGGAVGLVVTDGSLSADSISVSPVESCK